MDLTLREILDRYGPTIAVIIALIILVALFPQDRSAEDLQSITAGAETATTSEGLPTDVASEVVENSTSSEGGTVAASGGGGGGGPVGGSGKIADVPKGANQFAAKVCRPEDGRQRAISWHAVPCVGKFIGNNGGATARGVTAKEIKVINYDAQVNAATQAALIAAGADDDDETQARMDAALVDYFRHHYESYGRYVNVVTMAASGASSDDAAMRADAKTIADKHKAFAVWGAPDTLAEELAARKVICICTTSLSDIFYRKTKGYVFSSLPSAEEYATAISEYVGKRLKGRVAEHAGTGVNTQQRKFGLLYLESTSSGPRRNAKEGRDFALNEMKKYGITNVKAVGYSSDLTRSQEQSTNVISQFKNADVTSIIMLTDPLFPIFLTQEATRQAYFPEWLITGTALTDTTFFGRTYDKAQWGNAFGISPLWVFWVDVSTSSGYREYHHMRPGSNRGDEGVSINVRRSPVQWIFQGIHMAGPKLTPESFAQGMYNFPKTGGSPGAPLVFFTPEHPNAIKDFTEVWWNINGSGRDETGKDGPGTLMKVAGGKRYLTGSWPTSAPKVFEPAGAVYTKDLPSPKHEADGHTHKGKCLSCG